MLEDGKIFLGASHTGGDSAIQGEAMMKAMAA